MIGFVFRRVNYPNIISRPVYRELMYMFCQKDSPYHEDMDCKKLKLADEMFLRWGPDYQQWHDAYWSPDEHPCVTVNTSSTLQCFLNRPNRWAIAPMSIVHQMSHDTRLTYYRLTTPPPLRICYEITNRHHTMAQQRAIDLFNEELREFIDRSPDHLHF